MGKRFEGNFVFLYDKKMINSKNYLAEVFKGYAKKKVPFNIFEKDSVITLDTIGRIVTEKEYRCFYEDIRVVHDNF